MCILVLALTTVAAPGNLADAAPVEDAAAATRRATGKNDWKRKEWQRYSALVSTKSEHACERERERK